MRHPGDRMLAVCIYLIGLRALFFFLFTFRDLWILTKARSTSAMERVWLRRARGTWIGDRWVVIRAEEHWVGGHFSETTGTPEMADCGSTKSIKNNLTSIMTWHCSVDMSLHFYTNVYTCMWVLIRPANCKFTHLPLLFSGKLFVVTSQLAELRLFYCILLSYLFSFLFILQTT